MSTSYNKRTDGSRIGNWVEENALKDMTGTARYKVCATHACCAVRLPCHPARRAGSP